MQPWLKQNFAVGNGGPVPNTDYYSFAFRPYSSMLGEPLGLNYKWTDAAL
jgi:hypothetical protein